MARCWCCSRFAGHCSPCVWKRSGLVLVPPCCRCVVVAPAAVASRSPVAAWWPFWRQWVSLCMSGTLWAWGSEMVCQISGPGCVLHLVYLDVLGWLGVALPSRPWFSLVCSAQARWSSFGYGRRWSAPAPSHCLFASVPADHVCVWLGTVCAVSCPQVLRLVVPCVRVLHMHGGAYVIVLSPLRLCVVPLRPGFGAG